MLTFFTIPKAFSGHIGVIQRNAIKSWQRFAPECEVILLGDDAGTAEFANELGIRHIPAIARDKEGRPLISSVFAEAQSAASHSILCYVNADIILMSDFLQAVRSVACQEPRFLLVGRRWDIDIREPFDFRNGWEVHLRCLLAERGKLHAPTGVDYFVFPRGLWAEIPPFAIGRGAWDNWLIYEAKSRRTPVIDLTPMVAVAHQNHDYGYVAGRKSDPFNSQGAAENLALAGGYAHLCTVADANYRLTRKGTRVNLTPYYFYRRLVTLSSSHRTARWVLKAVRFLLGAVRGEKDTFAIQ
jgi:hypothetical protein